jgi:hypothetical protein
MPSIVPWLYPSDRLAGFAALFVDAVRGLRVVVRFGAVRGFFVVEGSDVVVAMVKTPHP